MINFTLLRAAYVCVNTWNYLIFYVVDIERVDSSKNLHRHVGGCKNEKDVRFSTRIGFLRTATERLPRQSKLLKNGVCRVKTTAIQAEAKYSTYEQSFFWPAQADSAPISVVSRNIIGSRWVRADKCSDSLIRQVCLNIIGSKWVRADKCSYSLTLNRLTTSRMTRQ